MQERATRAHATRFIGLLNGDGADDNVHDQAGLVSHLEQDIVEIAVQAHAPMRAACDDIIWVRGTEAHTRAYGALEELAACRLGTTKCPGTNTWTWWSWLGELSGVLCFAKHHPNTTSTRPWTRAAYRQAELIFRDFAERRENDPTVHIPVLAFLGHVHHFDDSGESCIPRTFYSPPWQLAGPYGMKVAWRGVEPVGGFLLICRNGKYSFEKRLYQGKGGAPWRPS